MKNKSCSLSRRRPVHRRLRGALENLEPRLALAADLEFAGAFQTLGSSSDTLYSSPYDGRGGGLATDSAGNRYISINGGSDQGVDLNPGPALNATTLDAGLVKLAPNGEIVWHATLNATANSAPVVRILHTVDADQNVYLVGDFRGTVDIDPGPGITQITSTLSGQEYGFYMAKLNSAGQLQWARTLAAPELTPQRVAVDDAGNLLIASDFTGLPTDPPMDVDAGPGQVLLQNKGSYDLVVLKYDPDGNFIWTRQLGNAGAAMAPAAPSLAVDGQGSVYISRSFTGTLDLDPGIGAHLVTNNDAAADGFVVRLDAEGNYVWAYATEGSGSATFKDIEIAADGEIVVAGHFKGTVDFQPGAGSLPMTSVGSYVNGIALKLASDSTIAWARQFGGLGETSATEADVDQEGNVYLGGSFGRLGQVGETSDFDPGPGVYELVRPSTYETAYVLSLTDAGDFRWAVPLGGNAGRAQVQGISVMPDGDVQLSGAFQGNADFDPDPAAQFLLNSGTTQSVFVATLSQFDPPVGAPTVDAGLNQTILVNQSTNLDGTVTDDGLPNPVTTTWTLFSGPGTVLFGNASTVDTTATFSTTGTYVLKLEAADGESTVADYVQIVVNPLTIALTATADTYIDGGHATTNYGTAGSIFVDGKPDHGALLKWDLSSIPAGSTLQSATLSINVTGASADTYEIYELKRTWSEPQATWKKSNSSTNWQSAGAQGALDRGSTVLGTVTASATGLRTVVLNAAGLAVVQGWLNNPATNFGFVLQDYANGTDDDLVFSSREATVAANRPQLQVVYAPPSVVPLAAAAASASSTSKASAAFVSQGLLVGALGAIGTVDNANSRMLGHSNSNERDAAVNGIFAEWTSARSHTERTAKVTSEGTANSFPARLNAHDSFNIKINSRATIPDDRAKSTLTAIETRDWHFGNQSENECLGTFRL